MTKDETTIFFKHETSGKIMEADMDMYPRIHHAASIRGDIVKDIEKMEEAYKTYLSRQRDAHAALEHAFAYLFSKVGELPEYAIAALLKHKNFYTINVRKLLDAYTRGER